MKAKYFCFGHAFYAYTHVYNINWATYMLYTIYIDHLGALSIQRRQCRGRERKESKVGIKRY